MMRILLTIPLIFFLVLTQIQKGSENGSLDVLGQNIKLIRQGYQKKNKSHDGEFKDIEANIRKLYDDLNIEIARLLSDEADTWKFSQENKIRQLNEEINSFRNELRDSQAQLDETRNTMENAQKEYIAILGIFAAVVLAFTGGITFSTSVLQNMHQASIYRVLSVVVLLGFVLVNTLFILFKFIQRLTRAGAENSISIKFPIIFNAVVVLLLLSIVLSWAFGVVEYRDERMQSSSKSVVETVSSEAAESDELESQ